jgi:hypothetical protein
VPATIIVAIVIMVTAVVMAMVMVPPVMVMVVMIPIAIAIPVMMIPVVIVAVVPPLADIAGSVHVPAEEIVLRQDLDATLALDGDTVTSSGVQHGKPHC